MNLFVQIPCFNEAGTIVKTIQGIPGSLPGVDRIVVLIVDDGSSDNTAQIAIKEGVDYVIRHHTTRGLAQAYRTGIDAAIRLGADIIINTDGDNQYVGAHIARLIEPIMNRKADMVIGNRQTDEISHFSFTKKQIQKIGTAFIRMLSGVPVDDAVCGFRALSREAALKLNVVTSFSYTIETLVQAGEKKLHVRSVPVSTNGKTRPSRLYNSSIYFIRRSVETLIKSYITCYPFRFFGVIGCGMLGTGALVGLAFFHGIHDGSDVMPWSVWVVLTCVLLSCGLVSLCFAFMAEIISVNRKLLEDILLHVREIEGRVNDDGEDQWKR